MNLHLLYETVMVRFDDVVEQQAIFIKYLCKNIYDNNKLYIFKYKLPTETKDIALCYPYIYTMC